MSTNVIQRNRYVFAIIMAIICLILVHLLALMVNPANMSEKIDYPNAPAMVGIILDISLIDPIAETLIFLIIFRVISMFSLKESIRLVVFLIISVFVFTMLHFPKKLGQGFAHHTLDEAVIIGTVGGTTLSLVYALTAMPKSKKGGFWPTALCHGVYNISTLVISVATS